MRFRTMHGAAFVLAVIGLSGCPADPGGPVGLDPLTCARTESVLATAPSGKFVTQPRLSADGRYALYRVDNGTGLPISEDFGIFGPKSFNLYLRDLQSSTTVQVNPAGTTARLATISGDGRYVAYSTPVGSSYPATAFAIDVWDRTTGLTQRITSNSGFSSEPTISGDGRYVAYLSTATDLVSPPDINANNDIFLWDRVGGTTTRLTDQSSAFVSAGALFGDSGVRFSRDGSTIVAAYAVQSTNHFVVSFINRSTGVATTVFDEPITVTDPAGNSVSQFVLIGGVSADGSVVSFSSRAPGLVTDTNWANDAYVFDRSTNTLTQVTNSTYVNPMVAQPANNYSFGVSGDGAVVAVLSNMVNPLDGVTSPPVLAGPSDPVQFMFRRSTGALAPISTKFYAAASADLGVLLGASAGNVLLSSC